LLLAVVIAPPGMAGCQAAVPANALAQSKIDDLEAAHYNLLEFEKCLDRAPDAGDPQLALERRRTTTLVQRARAKGLQPYLDQAAEEWRRIDSLADKVCYFQTNDFKGTSALLVGHANDRFQAAIDRF